jgi:predicted ATPase/class 3 adenylate cyclase
LTPDQRVRVFISSTQDELAAERAAARRAIARLHLVPVYYDSGARPHPPRSMYRAYLAQSQIFVGIYWQRYGWVVPGMGISGLEDEFRLAAGKPMLVYLKRPAPEMEPGLQAMIDAIRAAGATSYRTFTTPHELERLLADDLALLLSESFAGPASGAHAAAGAGESAGDGLPDSRTLSFLFTDIEGSTAMLRRLGGAYAGVLADHHKLIRDALAAPGGREVDTQGDAFFAVFGTARACAAAAITIQQAMAAHPWPGGEKLRVRIGLHAGEAEQTATGLVGLEVHRGARIAAIAYGGQILVSAAAAALLGGALPGGASLRDLGWHRLKDLGQPERIFQLDAPGLPTAFPPLRSLDNPRLPNNLPVQASAFIGRDAALVEVSGLIAAARLVTLTGAGGSGKTRLALQAAAGLLDGSGDGVWFTDLAPVTDPGLVAGTIAGVLSIQSEPGRPVAGTLVEAIGERSLLIVLDNCEQVIDACAKLADALLRGCPNLALLATSREPLGIDGEHVYRVPSLATPAPDADSAAIRGSEAVRLLADRAAQAGAPLTLDERTAAVIGRITRRLDGIPLAIELAAARLRAMSPADLDARLDQRFALLTGGSRAAPARQQTLLGMIGWSWDLLTGAERDVLARLSVFTGGFDLAACEAVTAGDTDIPAWQAMDLLGSLVDKSLVQFDDTAAGPGRYRLLETVRQFAARRLDEQGPTEVQDARHAHLGYYLALAETAAPQLTGPEQTQWLDRLDTELGNLRAAIAISQTQDDPAPGLRLAAALRVFWRARGHASEAADALRVLLGLPAASQTSQARAQALATAAFLTEQTSAAQAYCAEGLAIARASGDDHLVAELLFTQVSLLYRAGQTAAALPVIETGLGLARHLGDPHLTARLLNARSAATGAEGDHEGAARDAAESLALFRQIGDPRGVSIQLGNLGYIEIGTGQLASARTHLTDSLRIACELQDRMGQVINTYNLGLAEYLSGSTAAAASLFAESLELARRLFMKAEIGHALLGLAMTRSGPAAAGRSARLHGAADAALDALGQPPESLGTQLRDADRERLRAAMGANAFEAGYAAGQAMTTEDAIALALGADRPAEEPPASPRDPGPWHKTDLPDGAWHPIVMAPAAPGSSGSRDLLAARSLTQACIFEIFAGLTDLAIPAKFRDEQEWVICAQTSTAPALARSVPSRRSACVIAK